MDISTLRALYEEPTKQEREELESRIRQCTQGLAVDGLLKKRTEEVLRSLGMTLHAASLPLASMIDAGLFDFRLMMDNICLDVQMQGLRLIGGYLMPVHRKMLEKRLVRTDRGRLVFDCLSSENVQRVTGKPYKEAAALLLTHYIDGSGKVWKVSPDAFSSLSNSRAREIIEQLTQQKRAIYCGHLIKGDEKEMRADALTHTFRDRTEIMFPQKQADGTIQEESVRFYHRSPFSDEEVADIESGQTGALSAVLFAVEMDTESKTPKVTRQLRLLDIYSAGITFEGGKPLTAENIHELPMPSQVFIAKPILEPFYRGLNALGERMMKDDNNAQADSEAARPAAESAPEHETVSA